MARKTAAPRPPEISGEGIGPGLYRARDTFFWKGTTLVNRGDTVEAGHPMLDGRLHLFEVFAPTFPANGPQPLPALAPAESTADADAPADAETDDPAAETAD